MGLFGWDFHGVLERDNEYAVQEVVNRVLPEFKVKREATVEECRALYGKKWADYYRFYAPDADEETIHQMVEKAVKISLEEKIALKYIKQTEYASFVLYEIEKRGHTNLLMSNSSEKAIVFFLNSVGLSDYFDIVFAADKHRKEYNKDSKAGFLEDFLRKYIFDKVVIIDDMEEGIERGLRFNAVTFRYHRNGTAPESKAHYVINDLREVLREL